MKYYLNEYWEMVDLSDPIAIEEARTKWIKTAEKYKPYFDTIKDKLPKGFMKEFSKNSWFHDFNIDNINITSTYNGTTSIILNISHKECAYKLTFLGVERSFINIPNTKGFMYGKLTWGYPEFELNDDNTWIIRVLCDQKCEFEIHFKRISIEKLYVKG